MGLHMLARVKAFFGGLPPIYPSMQGWGSWVSMPGAAPSSYDLRSAVTSSVLMATLFWLMRAAPEAQLVVREQKRGADEPTPVPRHPLVTLVGRPNEYYAGEALWMATMLMWGVFGNAYWRIIPSVSGVPLELWWIPSWQLTPEGSSQEFISHYRYTPSGSPPSDIPREQIIHFRHGLDPENPRLGLSPIASVMREIMTDSESTNWVMSLLRNMAVPGLIITPKGDVVLSEADTERVKTYISSRFTGEHRGEPLALGAPTDVQKIAHSPSEMDMTLVHNTAEERVTAVLGVSSAVIGFGTGLENSKVGATMREFVGLSWTNGLIPPQRVMASELERALLPLYETRLDRFSVGWDYSRVAALQEDEGTKQARYDRSVAAGWCLVSDARAAMGWQVVPQDRVYLRSANIVAVEPDDQLPKPEPAPLRALPERTDDGEEDDREETEGEEAASHTNGYHAKGETKQGSLEEFIHQQISRHAARMETIPPALLRLAARQWRREQALQPKYQREIERVLRRYGDAAATAAREVLVSKQSLEDVIRSSIILERMPLVSIRADLEKVYQELYAEMLKLTEELMVAAAGAELTNPARLETVLMQAAQERVKLLDLVPEARQAILTSLEEARTAGLDEDAMIDLIRERVPAGRWLSTETRARIVARTESRFASNLSTASAAEQMGANRVLVLDARLGPTDETCEATNGLIVTPAEARMLAGTEHVNGTRGFLILNPQGVQAGGVIPGAGEA